MQTLANISRFELLQSDAHAAMGLCSDMGVFNGVSVSVTNFPELHGDPRPEEELEALDAAKTMKGAEQRQIAYDEEISKWRGMIQPAAGQTREELDANLKKETQKEFDKDKAAYQAGKSQWKMSGDGMKSKSYVDGFDDIPEDETKRY